MRSRAAMELAEAEPAVRDEGPHAQLVRQDERVIEMLGGRGGLGARRRDLAEEPERPRLVAALRRLPRRLEGLRGQFAGLVRPAGQEIDLGQQGGALREVRPLPPLTGFEQRQRLAEASEHAIRGPERHRDGAGPDHQPPALAEIASCLEERDGAGEIPLAKPELAQSHPRSKRGLTTSNFTVGSQGEVVDNQFAVLFVP